VRNDEKSRASLLTTSGDRRERVREESKQLTKLKKKGRSQTTRSSTSPSLKLTATEAATPSLARKENGGHTRRANSQIRRCRARKGKRQAWRLGKRRRKPKKVRGRPRSFYIIDEWLRNLYTNGVNRQQGGVRKGEARREW
jgi:GH24 family phage-related lysozyme (muramidase)